MINKEALNEIREVVFNLINNNIAENIRTTVGYHGNEVIKINFVGGLDEVVQALVYYGETKIGNFRIISAETTEAVKAQFKIDFDNTWSLVGDHLITAAIQNTGISSQILNGLINRKDVTIEGMGGVSLEIQFTTPKSADTPDDIYYDITIRDNGEVAFGLYDKLEPLALTGVSGGVGVKMSKMIKARMLNS